MAQPTKRRRSINTLVGIGIAVAVLTLVAAAGSSGSRSAMGLPVFALCAALALAINWAVFVPSASAQTERFFDLTGSLTYLSTIVLALALSDDLDARAWLAAALVVIWAARLGSFLYARIRRDGKDGRFDKIKTNRLRFFSTWTLQALWVVLTGACALAIITSQERIPLDGYAIVGLVVWLCGFTIEVVADRQKSAFRNDPANHGRFITTGLWAWSRHPNYFGEIVLWVGMAIISLPLLSGWRWAVLISPVFVVVLLSRLSGIPTLEHRAEKRWGDLADYRRYRDSTPVLLPRPPRRP